MTIEQATNQDALRVAEIWNHYVIHTDATFTTELKTQASIQEMMGARNGAFWVTKSNGHILGFATYAQFRNGPGYAHAAEHTVMLDPNAPRRTGMATALMSAVLTHAKDAGFHRMIAGINASNDKAVAFHAALGFSQIGRLSEIGRKFDRWHDLILMEKAV